MKFGILKDIKNGEYRVIATPTEVGILVADGNEVFICSGAGFKAGFDDADYAKAGAVVVDDNETIWKTCDFVAKVKEIEPSEYDLLREGQIIYTCIHPAAHKEEVDVLLDKRSLRLPQRILTVSVPLTVRPPVKRARSWDCGL